MEPMGPPGNAPGGLARLQAVRSRNIAPSSATIVIQKKNGVKLQYSHELLLRITVAKSPLHSMISVKTCNAINNCCKTELSSGATAAPFGRAEAPHGCEHLFPKTEHFWAVTKYATVVTC